MIVDTCNSSTQKAKAGWLLFEAILSYIANLKPTWTIYRDLVSKNQIYIMLSVINTWRSHTKETMASQRSGSGSTLLLSVWAFYVLFSVLWAALPYIFSLLFPLHFLPSHISSYSSGSLAWFFLYFSFVCLFAPLFWGLDSATWGC